MSALKVLIQKEKPDLICLNEIKCLEQEAKGDINVLGFDSLFKCRTAKGGGVAMLINESLKYDTIEILNKIKDWAKY